MEIHHESMFTNEHESRDAQSSDGVFVLIRESKFVVVIPFLPTRFTNTGNLAFVRDFAEADPAQVEFSEVPSATTAPPTAADDPR